MFVEICRILVAASLSFICLLSGARAETLNDVAELFGRADAIGGTLVSPRGTHLAMGCAPHGKPTICAFNLATSESILIPTIADTRMTRFYWASDETIILDIEIFKTLKTSDGPKNYAFERAVSFNLKNEKPVMLMDDQGGWLDANDLAAILPDDPSSVLFSMSRYSVGIGIPYYALYRVNLNDGKGQMLDSEGGAVSDVVHLPDGRSVAEVRFREGYSGGNTLMITANGNVLFERHNVRFDPVSIWGRDSTGSNLVVFLEEGEPLGLHRMSLADGTLTPIDVSANGGTVAPIIDPQSQDVVGFEILGDCANQIFDDAVLREQLASVSEALPNSVVTLKSWSSDKTISVMASEVPGRPIDYYLFEANQGALSPLGNSAPHLEGRKLGNIEPITYAARDGLTIKGFLTLPPGKTRADGPFPLILMPHGGPEAHDSMGFDWWTQAYAAAGYAVIQPNFRGSTGYGTKFRDAGYGEFGNRMVTDVLDAATWANAENIALTGNACIVGASYGGYSALMAGLHDPGALKCIVAVNAVTNPFGYLADFREGGFTDNYLQRYLGVARFDDPSARESITPTLRAAEYKTPILLIASKEDSTVPYRQSEQFNRAGRKTGKVKLVKIAGEDHYLRSTQARYDVLSNSLQFLDAHLPAN
jgi:dipeptidyl aminopeptidase/acylaminoacyl peptidase